VGGGGWGGRGGPVRGGDGGTEDRPARVTHLEGGVLAERIEAGRCGRRVDRLHPQCAPTRCGRDAKRRVLETQREQLRAAVRILVVDEPVAVVVDAVAALLGCP